MLWITSGWGKLQRLRYLDSTFILWKLEKMLRDGREAWFRYGKHLEKELGVHRDE